jgi:hypothetical protein
MVPVVPHQVVRTQAVVRFPVETQEEEPHKAEGQRRAVIAQAADTMVRVVLLPVVRMVPGTLQQALIMAEEAETVETEAIPETENPVDETGTAVRVPAE